MTTSKSYTNHECEILLQAAVPEIYKVNAFRVSGLNVNANTPEITNQLQKNQLYEKYGDNSISKDVPFPILPKPDTDQIRHSLHRLRDPETRLIDEFFWFWPHSIESGRDDALDALSKNDISGAEKIWINYEAILTESNVSRHNLAVLSHLLALDIELNGQDLTNDKIQKRDNCWKEAFKRWKLLIEHEGFWSRLVARVRQMNDPRLTIGFVRSLRESIPLAILQINAQLALTAAENGNEGEAKRHLQILKRSGFGNEVELVALKNVVEPTRNRIKLICKSFANDVYPDAASQINACHKLIEQTRNLLKTLDILLPFDSIIKEGAHDEVAITALNLIISYSYKITDYEGSLEIIEKLRLIVIGESASSRVNKNYDIFKNNIEYDLIHNRCFYCKKNKADNNSVIQIKMHGEVVKNVFLNQIKWRHITIQIPRCLDCKKEHDRVDSYTWIGGGIGFLIGMVAALIVEFGKGGFWTLLVITVIGFITGSIIGSSKVMTAKYGSYRQFPQIKDLQNKGWTWGEKPPTDN